MSKASVVHKLQYLEQSIDRLGMRTAEISSQVCAENILSSLRELEKIAEQGLNFHDELQELRILSLAKGTTAHVEYHDFVIRLSANLVTFAHRTYFEIYSVISGQLN